MEMKEKKFDELWERAKTFNILQKKEEMRMLWDYLHRPEMTLQNFLEIGTQNGGTASIFLENFLKGDSIDLEPCKNIDRLREINPDFTQIIGNSQSIKTLEFMLKEKKCEYDMIFIDGGHDAKTVLKDFLFYRNFLKRHGIIVFHDIVPMGDYIINQYVDCGLVWETIKLFNSNNMIEFIEGTSNPDSEPFLNELNPAVWGGLGVLL